MVSYLTTGALGSRIFTMQWYSVSDLMNQANNYNFQVKLYEGSNVIEFHYGTMLGSNNSATIGIQDINATEAFCGPNCTNTNSGSNIINNYIFTPAAA
jgi:hypothetical protein